MLKVEGLIQERYVKKKTNGRYLRGDRVRTNVDTGIFVVSIKSWDDIDRATDAINAEIEYWRWTNNMSSPEAREFFNGVSVVYTSILNDIQSGRSSSDEQESINKANAAINLLNNAENAFKLIKSGTALAQFIERERQSDPEFAARLAWCATKSPGVSVPVENNLDVLFALNEFSRGLSKKSAASAQKSIESIRKQLLISSEGDQAQSRIQLKKFDLAVKSREKKAASATKASAAMLVRHRAMITKLVSDVQTKLEENVKEMVTATNAQLAETKEYYETNISLQEPISYWKQKKIYHRRATISLGLVFIIYSLILALVTFSYIRSFDMGLTGFISFWKDATLSAFGAFGLLFAMALAIARIVFRLFASQLHLWNDSSERVTMMQTYLSFAQKGHAKEEFLGALMSRLFSPSSDGVVKDDFGSVGALDAVVSRTLK